MRLAGPLSQMERLKTLHCNSACGILLAVLENNQSIGHAELVISKSEG
jgi:hypothetical protein